MQQCKKQKGYTMVLFIAFIVAVLLAGFSLYDNGVVASERIRIQNTADATVYSTVNVLSRDMNFIAYTNRSMVANQVAIAQVVGLSSWTHMMDKAVQNLDDVMDYVQIVPYIGPVLKKITQVMAKFSAMAKKGMDAGAKGSILATDGLISILAGGQKAFQLVSVKMAVDTYTGISKANDKDIKTNLLLSGVSFAKLLKSWNDNVSRNHDPRTGGSDDDKAHLARFEEFAGVVRASRDPFSQNRSYFWFDWIPLTELLIARDELSIQKKGGTDFISTKKGKKLSWQWTAMDTVSVWNYWEIDLGWLGSWSGNDEVLKMGWGAAHALANGKSKFDYSNYKSSKQSAFYEQGNQKKLRKWRHWGNDQKNRGAWRNSSAAKAANKADKNNNLMKTTGLRDFYDLKGDEKKDTGPSMIVLLDKSADSLRLQETLDKSDTNYNRSSKFKIEENGSITNNKLYGLARAETYFSRPRELWKRKDGYREYGNLYNPFWQTRLIDTSNTDRFAAIAAAHLLK